MKKLWWLCCLVFLTVFAVQPAEAGLISKEEEINMGRDTARQIEAQYGLYQDPAAQERVNRIGQSLVAVLSGVPDRFCRAAGGGGTHQQGRRN